MLCVPLTVTGKKEVRKFLSAANRHADCIELRLDYFRRKPDLKKLVAGCKKPVIVTLRKKSEGGKYGYNAKARLALYSEAIRMQVDYVDIELSSGSLIAGLEKVLAGRIMLFFLNC
jgi:3-dehydroquinate dehydratase/shikimate dehydrogenase